MGTQLKSNQNSVKAQRSISPFQRLESLTFLYTLTSYYLFIAVVSSINMTHELSTIFYNNIQ